jgi:plasmid stability protein
MSERKNMPDLLVPDLDPATYERLRQTAADRGKSLAQTARDLLSEKLQPSRAEVWAAADRLREKIAKVSGNSTADIREWRDNADPNR